MKAIVTGGAGFIGSHLVEHLVSQEVEVTVLDNLQTGSIRNLEKIRDHIHFIEDNCGNISQLTDSRTDVIFHLGMPSSSPMYDGNDKLVGHTLYEFKQVLECCRKHNAPVIFATSSSIYGQCEPPHSEDLPIRAFDNYTHVSIEIQRLAREAYANNNIRSIGLRLFSVYGPHEMAKGTYANLVTQFCWAISAGKSPVIYGDGTQSRDFIHVDDVVRGFTLAADAVKDIGYASINIGTGRETTLLQLVEKLNSNLGKKCEPTMVPNPIIRYVVRTRADTTRSEQQLGFQAGTDIDTGIKQIISYYAANDI